MAKTNHDELSLWLDHLFLCVQRHIHRYGFRMTQASGTLNQMYVSLDEARSLLSRPQSPMESQAPGALGLPELGPVEEKIAESRAALKKVEIGAVASLRDRFGLSVDELRLLLAAAGPLISIDLSRLYGFAWADFAIKLPSVGFLTEMIADSPEDSVRLQGAFLPDSPLVRYRLLELRDVSAWGTPSPTLHRGAIVPGGVLAHLRGEKAGLPTNLASACKVYGVEDAIALNALHGIPEAMGDLRRALLESMAPGRRLRPRPLLIGTPGVGRRTTVAAAVAPRGWGVLMVDLGELATQPETFTDRLASASREALLRRSVLLLRGDDLLDDRERWDKIAPSTCWLLDRHAGPAVFTHRTAAGDLHRMVSGIFDVPFKLPDVSQQRAVWTQILVETGEEADGDLADSLARRFSISPGIISKSVEEARARRLLSGRKGPLEIEEVADPVRHRLKHTLSQVAEPFGTSLTWDDVILPTEVRESLDEIMSHARFRERVYDDWGFRRKMSYGRGLGCLFSGVPGTGKTMVAALIAQSLGRELYKVDLSRVVSKWVGETEKNLARVFDEAERAQIILLFDEADSLFSSRTEVKGSNDRFANMEVNYLLQRMESFDGMSLLTTNFEKSIDEAFKRRLKFKINFPMPEAEDRAKLWSVMLPDHAEIADDIDYELLGKRYKMTGGHIKNAVLRAAFYAADLDRPISQDLLLRAGKAELVDMGRLI